MYKKKIRIYAIGVEMTVLAKTVVAWNQLRRYHDALLSLLQYCFHGCAFATEPDSQLS